MSKSDSSILKAATSNAMIKNNNKEKAKNKNLYRYVKRILDLILATVLIIPASLIITICAIAIKIESKGPVFFTQDRPGYKGRIFKVYKLRTMIVETERDGKPLSNMDRITKVGAIIRTCSFDELPQIWNVLNHTMSFIGPRPLLIKYLPLYSQEQMRRHDVLPGITGWAQVNGRNELTWEQKFERDVYYVDHMSFGLDVKIFWMTIDNVFKREGINAGINETMTEFKGNFNNTDDLNI